MKEMEIKNKLQYDMALQEAEMLKEIAENIQHVNILQIEKIFQVGSKFYLVFPLCTGGELYDHVVKRGHFTEVDAASIARDLISGIHALHQHNLIHLDIKPENILFETESHDAKIKITDFGLSKILPNDHMIPSYEQLQQKLQQFQQDGVLDREKLRGTVGYMAPELILCGTSCKATDVFAAGVVLYILLCGYPPFQAKANRDVLEKTCKGSFKMVGKEWEAVSEDAKDLIRKMLIVDPSQRISTTDILQHPWLLEDHDDEQHDQVSEMKETSSNKVTKSLTSLSSTLRTLSGHVQQQKSEKLVTRFTKLLTTMQAIKLSDNKTTSSSLLVQFLKQEETVSDEAFANIFMNPDVRQALSHAIMRLEDEPGKISIQHFINIFKHFFGISKDALGANTSTSSMEQGQNFAFMIICKFIDRDGDGFISADDIVTSQALVIQRSEVFLRSIFRIYCEVLWYPGRQLNIMSLYTKATQASLKKDKGMTDGTKVIEDTHSINNDDVVEPPKFITTKHVGQVFEKLGYAASIGHQVFEKLHDLVVQSVLNEESEDSHRESEVPDDITHTSSHSSLHDLGSITSQVRRSSTNNPSADVNAAGLNTSPVTSTFTSPRRNSMSHQKMDIHDFIKACQLDDVLVQVLLSRHRSAISHLFHDTQNEAQARVLQEEESTSNVFVTLLEEKFYNAFNVSSGDKSTLSFPIANAVGRATLSAVFDVASKVTQGVNQFMDS